MLITDPPVQVTRALWMLGTNEYPLFLFRGEQDAALFEGGVAAVGPLVLEQLDGLGVARESITQLVVAHAHPDHTMAVPTLKRALPNLSVVASPTAAKTLSIEKAISFFVKVNEAITAALIEKGEVTEAHRAEPLSENRIEVDRVVKQGDVIAVDGQSFDVLETPGHSDCSLSFYEPDRKILFISDATGYYMPKHECWWPNYFASYGTYVDSMKRLAAIDTETLCLGHHAAMTGADDVQTYFRNVIAATEQLHREIVEEVKAGKTVREVAERLGTDVHKKLPLFPLDFYQKNCGLLVKASLKHEGIEA